MFIWARSESGVAAHSNPASKIAFQCLKYLFGALRMFF